MTQARLNRLLGQLQRAGARPAGDGELLGQFIERREEDAFAALLRRHGPMVLGVCRRILGDAHDAEDAFQATFLVLVRKAASIRPREAVGSWLYGVAYRTALEARTRRIRRRRRERQVAELPPVEARPADPWEELRPLLDREVHRLPDIYRLAIVLCDLEGRSRKAAAEQLGVPEGTLSSRLAAARKRLARRLSRHGSALTAGALAILVSKNATAATVPAALVESTTRAALLMAAGQAAAVSGAVAALTEGVLKTMFLAKLKTVTVLLLGVTVLSLGTGTLYYAADPTQKGPLPAARDKADPVRDGRKPVADQERALDRAVLEQRTAVDRERALREELELARQEAAKQRDLAQAALQEAEQQRQQAEKQLQQARLQLERARTAARQQGQGVDTVGQQGNPVGEDILQHLKLSAEKLRSDYLARREHLQMRLKQLEAEREQVQAQLQELEARARRDEESLRQKLAEIRSQHEIRPEQRKAPQQVGGDKLDRILERLEQMERRLDRLERRGR